MMSAHRRFVLGAQLLLVAALVLIAGSALWSRIDTRHSYRITAPNACPQLNIQVASGEASTALDPGHASAEVTFVSGAPCGAHLERVDTWTAPNHVPALVLLILGAATGLVGVGVARSHPEESNEPATE